MHTIRRQVDVHVSKSLAEESWPYFVKWILTGGARLACDELFCVDAAAGGRVRFEKRGETVTTVIFELDVDDGAVPLDEIERKVGHDLITFTDYVERRHGSRTKSDRRAPRRDARGSLGDSRAGSDTGLMFWRR